MLKLQTYFLVFGGVFLFCKALPAQPTNRDTGAVKGVITDSRGETIGFASISLLAWPDSSQVKGMQAKTDGSFLLEAVPAGRYVLSVTSIGYNERVIADVGVNAGATTDLGRIILDLEAETLEEVVVERTRPEVQYDLDKTTFAVTENIKSISTNAGDVLQQIPMVELDQEGVPSVMGQGVSVLIDGKPSRTYGDNIETVLKLIPAELIERIEVVTSPSARYSTEDGGIVLNIITKSDYLTGISGIANFSATTNKTYSPSVNINISGKKISFNNSVSFDYDRDLSQRNLFRENFPTGTPFFTDQRSQGIERDRAFSYNGNLYYNVNPKTRIGAFFGVGRDTEREDETLNTAFLSGSGSLDSAYTRFIDSRANSWNYRAGIDLDRTFSGAEHVFNLEAYYSTRSDDDDLFFDQESEWEHLESLQNQLSRSGDVGFTIEGDYVQPFGKDSRLEAGFRADWEKDDNVFEAFYFDDARNDFVINPGLSNDFVSLESDFSLYGMYRAVIGKFSLQAGLRLENTILETTQHILDQHYKTNFLNLIPTLNLSYRLANKDNILFSYSRRARTPRWDELNPFVDYSDPQNIESGNPGLRPESTDSFEGSYNKFINRFNFFTSVFYRYSNEPIQQVRTVDEHGISYTNYDNIGSEHYYGLEAGVGAELLPDWNVRLNAGLRQNKVFGFEADNQTTASTAGFSTFFPLPFDFRGYVFSRYSGPQSIAQGRRKAIFMTNVGVRKSFFDERADFSIRFSDVFNNQRWSTTLRNNAYYQTSDYYRQSRFLTLNLSYTFGQLNNDQEPKDPQRDNQPLDESINDD